VQHDWQTSEPTGQHTVRSRPRQRPAHHLLRRGGIWYWVRRLPAVMRGTVATSEHAQLRLSLRTQDGGLARSRGLQLDAALDRIRAAMTTDAPARQVLTPAAIAALLRDAVLDAGERRRALRPPDEPAPKPKWAGCTLPRELTRDVIAVAQMADAQLATGMADDISDVPLDASLTARLLDAAAAVVTPVALPVELGASEARSAAFRGRAGLILRDLRRGDLTLGQDSLDRLAAAEGVEVAPENRALAARAAMRALAAAALVGADREQGVYAAEPPPPAASVAAPLAAACPVAPASPLAEGVAAPALAVVQRRRASELLEGYLAGRTEGKGRVLHHTNAQDRRSIELLIAVCGDRPLAEYGREDMTRFLSTLRQLPAKHGKSPQHRGQSAEEMIALAKAAGLATLTDKTVKRHASAISQFLQHGVDNGHLSNTARKDIIENHRFHLGNPREDRDRWTSGELRRLFSSPVWTGCHRFFRTEPGSEIVRDAKFWLPLLEAFHGNRLEEFADLRGKDVICEDGVHGLMVDDEHRRLKTNNAKRRIPLHPELIRIGFLDYAISSERRPDDPLFPDIAPQGKDRKRGPRITRWFVEYRKAIGIYRPGVASHALRHEARTRLANVVKDEQQKRHMNYIFGHAVGSGEGDQRYDKGPPLIDAVATLGLLCFPEIDLRHLHVR
jgi:hypothetical protein